MEYNLQCLWSGLALGGFLQSSAFGANTLLNKFLTRQDVTAAMHQQCASIFLVGFSLFASIAGIVAFYAWRRWIWQTITTSSMNVEYMTEQEALRNYDQQARLLSCLEGCFALGVFAGVGLSWWLLAAHSLLGLGVAMTNQSKGVWVFSILCAGCALFLFPEVAAARCCNEKELSTDQDLARLLWSQEDLDWRTYDQLVESESSLDHEEDGESIM